MDPENNLKSHEDYSTHLIVGIILILVLAIGVGLYWLNDSTRLEVAAKELLSDRIDRGEEIYIDQCGTCHGVEGGGGLGPALNDRSLLKNTLDDVFFSVIRSGIPNTQMPAWSVDFGGPLTDEDIRDVVAFMRAWEPTAPESTPETDQPDPKRGALLFASTCAVCHGEEGKVGQEGVPGINNPERLQRLENDWYREVIANGRPAQGMPTWGTVLSPQQLDDLVALIDAWREGETVNPPYSNTTLFERASFALSQEDTQSARLHLERALQVTSDPGAKMIRNVLGQIDNGDLEGALGALQALQKQWPLGDPASGAQIYSTTCSACHGPQGEGGIGTALQDNEFIQDKSNAQLLGFLLEGRPGTAMAGFEERLSEANIADLIAFLRLWQK
ncbi:MAG: c-type cytochrome [Anaerolineales bacterium]|jgi:mono/diheme cytochrome c family protein